MFKLKSLIVEQTERADLVALQTILNQQQDIFMQTLNKLESIDYSTITDEAAETLTVNAKILCQAYVEYCKNTESTIKQYPDESVETIVDENANTLLQRIDNELIR
jgi:hypothetical protein